MEKNLKHMSSYINDNYDNIKAYCLFLTRNKVDADELMGEFTLALLSRKSKFPEKIINEKKEWLYIYVTIRHMFFNKNSNFNKNKYNLSQHLSQVDIIEAELKEDEEYNYEMEEMEEWYNLQMEQKKINWYDGTLFGMFYFPHSFFEIDNIPRKMSYRKLQELTAINFQSLRLSIIRVRKYIKQNYINK